MEESRDIPSSAWLPCTVTGDREVSWGTCRPAKEKTMKVQGPAEEQREPGIGLCGRQVGTELVNAATDLCQRK